MAEYGLSAADSQDANPYQRRRKDSYQDEARQRALSTAVTGGAQPQQTELGANQPGGYDRAQNRGRQYNYGNEQSRRKIDLGDGGGSASGRLQSQSPSQPYEQGGVTGGTSATPIVDPGAAPSPPPAIDYTTMGEYGGKMGGYNTDKFAKPWGDMSEKYQIGTVLSHFDPNKGLTPEAIAALNQANIHGAKFSGQNDKLTVDNVTGYDRFGTGGTADIIQGFKNPNQDHNWGAWFVDDQAQQQQNALGNAIQGGAWGEGGAYGGSNGYPWQSRNTQTGGDALQLIYQMLNPLMSQSGLGGGQNNAMISALLGSGGSV